MVLCGISTCFQVLSPCLGQIVHALLTRPPLEYQPKSISPLDLHVLSTPPAFVLSQDQTLMFNPYPQPPSFRFVTRQSRSASALVEAFNSFRNLTVFLVFYLRLCIVFKFRSPRRSGFVALARGDRCYYSRGHIICQHLFSSFYFFHLHVTIRSNSQICRH